MDATQASCSTIDAYISQFDPDIQDKLQKIRDVIKRAAPDAEEKISYQMPTFFLQGNLVHFAAMKNHIGFYPSPSGITAFSEHLVEYKCSKGAIQFPLDKSIPYELITKIVQYRVNENLEKYEAKKIVKSKK